jgi:hypothetical protein
MVTNFWIITLAWALQRLAKDFENLTRSKIAFVKLAMIRLPIRRVARSCKS